jgi:hypothetical protein
MEQEKEPMPEIYFPDFGKKISTTTVILIASGLIVLAIIIGLLTQPSVPKIEHPDVIKKQVDSLAKANAELQAKQASLDSAAKVYEGAIIDLDWKIQNVGRDKTIIKEYYHEKVKEPKAYTPKQVDSFFKKRYNY